MRHRCIERWGQRGGGERKREEDAAAAAPCAGIWESGYCVDVDWCAVCPWPSWKRHAEGRPLLVVEWQREWYRTLSVCALLSGGLRACLCALVCLSAWRFWSSDRYLLVTEKCLANLCNATSAARHRHRSTASGWVSDADGSSASLLCSPARVAPAAFVGPGRLVAAHTGTCPARPPCRGRLGAAA